MHDIQYVTYSIHKHVIHICVDVGPGIIVVIQVIYMSTDSSTVQFGRWRVIHNSVKILHTGHQIQEPWGRPTSHSFTSHTMRHALRETASNVLATQDCPSIVDKKPITVFILSNIYETKCAHFTFHEMCMIIYLCNIFLLNSLLQGDLSSSMPIKTMAFSVNLTKPSRLMFV